MTHTLGRSRLRAAAFTVSTLAAVLLATGCAEKSLTTPSAWQGTRLSMRIAAQGVTLGQGGPLWLVVAAGYMENDEFQTLGVKFVPAQSGVLSVPLEVDIAPCLSANAARSRPGCSLYIGAALVPDTLVVSDSTRETSAEAFDVAYPVGPFEVTPGQTPSIPAIDLSLTRLAAVQWADDPALSVGGVGAAPVISAGAIATEVAPVGVAANGTGELVLFAATFVPSAGVPTPQLARFENGAWRRLSAPAVALVNGTNQFSAVHALSTTNVYASATTGLWRYDGTLFTRVAGGTDALHSVHAIRPTPTTQFVVAGGEAGAVWMGDGTSFQRVPIPVSARVTKVCASAVDEVFAVVGPNTVYRFNGSTWSPQVTATNFTYSNLDCPSRGVAFVMGSNGQLTRYDAGTWSSVTTAGLGSARVYHSVAASPNDIWVYGDSARVNRRYYRYNGSSWSLAGTSRYTSTSSAPVLHPGGGVVAVGPFSRVERAGTGGLTVLSYQPSLRAVAVNSASSAFAVGWPSLLARWNGTQWEVDAPPAALHTQRVYQAVWSSGATNAWTVGQENTILRFNGSSWTAVSDSLQPAGPRDDYNAVWSQGTTTWVAGNSTVVRCDNSSCSASTVPGSGALLGLWGASPSAVFAVGDNGRILRFNGTSWSAMASPTTAHLARVSGSSATDVWAVGDGVVLHFDGTSWQPVPLTGDLSAITLRVPPPNERVGTLSQYLTGPGLWARTAREVYIAGEAGRIVRYDGYKWTLLRTSPFGRALSSIHGTLDPSGCVLAVGEAQLPTRTTPSLVRGVGPTGCFGTPMGSPASWP